ncbi:hypothetical protein PH213_20290 [Streptomyces sp. SRF1]|nr:hypothetical protein [Streptomyces sp. SRF1]MDN3056846.1 hypothetical protein [Streptomyces sp. SRF1]
MSLQVGPCDPWPIEPCCDVDEVDPADLERWQRVASSILWALSGRRWGPCPITVRPCRRACLETAPISFQAGVGTGPWVPYIGTDGVWRNASVCGCRPSDCSCGELCEIYLPGPVYDVVEVNDGGQILTPGLEYRVDAPGRLVRLGGPCWPTCQDMAEPEGTPGTLTVTYRWGLPLDAAAIAAVSELTCHFLKGCGGGTCGCNANRNVTRVTRQGVEMERQDPTLLYAEGLTGLPTVDMWLMAVNPNRLAAPSRVYSPDFKRPRVTTWP